jgi:tetratricopeptide (TPR) repeat protein
MEPNYKLVWYALLPSIVITLFTIYGHLKLNKYLFEKKNVLISIVCLSIAVQLFWIYNWYDKRAFDLKDSAEDISQILGKDAVIVGPYSNTLAVGNDLISIIYMFGLTRNESDLFKRIPITHLAIDVTNWEAAIKDFPWLEKNSTYVTGYWVRDVEVALIRILNNEQFTSALNYKPTRYEEAMDIFARAGSYDSVMYNLTIFLNTYPKNKSGLKLLASAYERSGNFKRSLEIHDKLISIYPRDFSRHYDKAVVYYKLYVFNNDITMQQKADEHFALSQRLNPYLDDDISIAKKQVADNIKN